MVLVDHPGTLLAASHRGVHRDDDGRVVVGWQLLPPLMRSVVVEMVHVLADHGLRVPLVVDQNVVGAFLAQAAAPALDETVRRRGLRWDLHCLDVFGDDKT